MSLPHLVLSSSEGPKEVNKTKFWIYYNATSSGQFMQQTKLLFLFSIENAKEGGQCKIGGLSIVAARNSYGRQIESSEQKLLLKFGPEESNKEFPGVFIRAPKILKVHDYQKVQVLAINDQSGEIVGVRQKNIMATSFHPELTTDLRFHQYFVDMIKGK